MFRFATLFLPRGLLESLNRLVRGPLPEVSEVDWSEWESTVSASDEKSVEEPSGWGRTQTGCETVPDLLDPDGEPWSRLESVSAAG